MAVTQNNAFGSFLYNLKEAVTAALLTAVMLAPVFALHLETPKPPETALRLGYEWRVILIGTALVFCAQLLRPYFTKGVSGLPIPSLPELTPRAQQVCLLVLLLGSFAVMVFGSRADIAIGQQAMIYIILALGLNIVVGFAGLLNLGYAGFYAIGAYTYALLNTGVLKLGFWQSLPFAALFAAFIGAALGFVVLRRLRGDYLAIVTLGFAEIIRIVVRNIDSFGGPGGINGIGKPSVFGYEMALRAPPGGQTFHQMMGWSYQTIHMQYFLYLIGILFAVCAVAVAVRLSRMPLGRALEAMREDEIACRSLGLNPVSLKVFAFGLGSAFAGVAGALFAARQGAVSPEAFGFLESVLILVAVVVGGMGSLVGVIVGGILIAILVMAGAGFAEYRMLYFGIILVVMMIWRPQGLLPVGRRHVKVKP